MYLEEMSRDKDPKGPLRDPLSSLYYISRIVSSLVRSRVLNSNSILNPVLVTTSLVPYYLLVPLFDTILSRNPKTPRRHRNTSASNWASVP